VRNRLLAGNSDLINSIGYLLALCALIAVGLNVRKTYVSIHGASEDPPGGNFDTSIGLLPITNLSTGIGVTFSAMTAAPVREPSSLLLLGSGLALIVLLASRSKVGRFNS
jgi:hypothetical protein